MLTPFLPSPFLSRSPRTFWLLIHGTSTGVILGTDEGGIGLVKSELSL